MCYTLTLPEEPIPQIAFRNNPDDIPANPYPDRLTEDPVQHVKRILDKHVYAGYWYDDAWLAFVRWLLHGFGRRGLEDKVNRIPEEVRDYWYTQSNLAYLLVCPIDWSAYILQGSPRWMKTKGARWAKASGFFSTPMDVCQMMARMTFIEHELGFDERDTRLLSVCDPCVGTGSMLLVASNYSLRLAGQDIVYDLCLCAELNGYLWMPWLVCMPEHVRAWLLRLAGEGDREQPASVHLETDPEVVDAVQRRRQEQYALFEAMGAETPPEAEIVCPASSHSVQMSEVAVPADQLDLF
jgi:hypothetical protein